MSFLDDVKYNAAHTHAIASTVMVDGDIQDGDQAVRTVFTQSFRHTHTIANHAYEVNEEEGVYALEHDHFDCDEEVCDEEDCCNSCG